MASTREAGKAIGESLELITGVLVRKCKKTLLKIGVRIMFLEMWLKLFLPLLVTRVIYFLRKKKNLFFKENLLQEQGVGGGGEGGGEVLNLKDINFQIVNVDW